MERVLFYEGDEYYLAPVILMDNKNTAHSACVFLSNGIYRTGTEEWCFDTWQQIEKVEFLKRVRKYMQYFGQLTATEADKHW